MISNLLGQNRILEKALDASWLKNEVISQNIANVDTPGYKRLDVNFEDQLSSALERRGIQGRQIRNRHMDIGRPSVENVKATVDQHSGTSMRMDGNNVDVDYEMTQLARNTIVYNSLVQKASKEFIRMKSVINEGR